MDITVKAKCEVPTRIKEEAVERLEHAARFFDRLVAIETIFSAEPNPRVTDPATVEVTGHTRRHHIRAQGWGPDHRHALDMAVTRFERQLSRYKARMVDRRRVVGGRKPVKVATADPVGDFVFMSPEFVAKTVLP